jgi:VanW like protein
MSLLLSPWKWMQNPTPSNLRLLRDEFVFSSKATLLKARRTLHNRYTNPTPHHRPRSTPTAFPPIAQSVTPLWTEATAAEQELVAGKIENLRVAIAHIHQITIPAGQVFSFWAQVGAPTRSRGYVIGRELRQGCIIPNVGGGLCQLSNALYSAALDAGLEILERHAHSKIIPGSLAEVGRDATVFWNYIDLRFKAPYDLTIAAHLTTSDLVVTFYGDQSTQRSTNATTIAPARGPLTHNHSCRTCGNHACAKSESQPPKFDFGKTRYLVDEYWPEFDRYRLQCNESTAISLPLDGEKLGKPNYQWSIQPDQATKTALLTTISRSFACRKLQGQSLQSVLMQYDEKLAQQYARHLAYDVTHIVVAQNLLPFLWQMGALGGRRFDVLMTRSPLATLQKRLDQAAQNHPDSPTLADFRVDPALVLAETQALLAARQLITPHRDIAAIYPHKTQQLSWEMPIIEQPFQSGQRILFPATTLGRSGCYEMRSAAQAMGLELTLAGPVLEAANFWGTIPTHKPQKRLLDGVELIVLPAYIHHKPRLLLRAIAAGIPVIATAACGVSGLSGVTIVPTNDVDALVKAIAINLS